MAKVKAVRVWTHALLSLVSVAWAIGCSGGKDNTPVSASKVESLSGPVTITLSTPNPVSPIAPVLEGASAVQLGGGAHVVTGVTVSMGSAGLQASPDVLLNETWSRGTATLNDRVQVRGTLHAHTRVLGNGVVIASSDTNPPLDPPQTLSWTVTFPSGTPTNVLLNAGQTQSLAPGSYGSVTLNSRATLTLHTGTYFLTGLDLESQSTVNLDQANGPVIIYIANALTYRGAFVGLDGAPPDLLLAYLGTAQAFIETLFNGAIIAPSASITLRSVGAIHTGFFAAKTPILDANSQVQYRAPLAVVAAANPPGPTCRQLLANLVPPSQLPHFCKACLSPDDTDLDGVQDCLDGCPYDPKKTDPGICGCGIPNTDSDGDGVPDCLDKCPNDPNNSSVGQCGCQGKPGLAAAGTACTDTACPQTGTATCNGAGVCGNRSNCSPAVGCKLVSANEDSYWFCPGPLTRTAAAQACNAKGMALARIDTISENRFVNQFETSPYWIGANSIAASGTWRWSAPGNDNGDQFWAGNITGAQRNGLFSYWAKATAPATQRCASGVPITGRWMDTDCTQALAYVCEFKVPIVATDAGAPPPGIANQPAPMAANCAQVDSGLPSTIDELKEQLDGAAHNMFVGAAANPPPDGSTCAEDASVNAIGDVSSGAGCQLTDVKTVDCLRDSDCSTFGSGFVCRQLKDDQTCLAPKGPETTITGPVQGATCVGHARCGRIVCPSFIKRCNDIDLCDPHSVVDAGPDPGSNLDAQALNPAALFEAGLPDASSATTYVDPPAGSGVNHSWCFMNPQNPTPAADQPSKNQGGTSGGTSKISFGFDPDLVFHVDPGPLTGGESDLDIHAAATLQASVNLNNFLGQNYSAPILEAGAGIRAKRCSLTDKETQLQVFGLDAVQPDGVLIFDTDDQNLDPTLFKVTKTCNDTFGEFIVFANRAKKAFRDAQQLLTQYHSLKQVGSTLKDLCQQTVGLVGTDVPLFPGGLTCPPNEPVEITINRFLDYYQAPGFGQVSQLRQAASKLFSATQSLQNELPNLSIDFLDISQEESQNVVDVPFAIGPVPMLLQIDVFASYGIAGNFDLALKFPLSLDTPVGDLLEIAHVKAGVLPHASAGLSAFVGAGTDLGAFSATVGIEGAVTLAEIAAPIFAGAGVGVTVTSDIRPIPNDIQPPVALALDAFQFSIPKSFKFSAWYDYGAAVDLKHVLSGEVNGKLRISFLFFSRTWRKRIVKFNGWSFHFNLVSGGSGTNPNVGKNTETVASKQYDTQTTSTNSVEGNTDMGLSQPQVPLMVLAPLSVADGGSTTQSDGGAVPFDAGAVQKLFYDDQCCAKGSEQCSVSRTPRCCPGFGCVPDIAGGDQGTCSFECRHTTQDCVTSSDCCSIPLSTVTCDPQSKTCATCGNFSAPCKSNQDCCNFGPTFGCGTTGPHPSHTCGSIIP